MTDVSQDLLWHGRALCRALDRAGRAERELLELTAEVECLLDALVEHGRASARVVEARYRVAALLAAQDAPEPPRTAEGSPDVLDVP